jgi:hypothetical protein
MSKMLYTQAVLLKSQAVLLKSERQFYLASMKAVEALQFLASFSVNQVCIRFVLLSSCENNG